MESTVGCSLLVLLITSVMERSSAEPCAIFEFPTLNDSTLTAKENSTIILPFYINTDPGCNLSDHDSIRIQVLNGGQSGDFCAIRQFSGSCYGHSGIEIRCECKNGTGFYHLKKTADRIDSTQWRFTTEDGMVENKITFNILYPATVEGVTLMSDDNETLSLPVEPGSSVDVGCYWQHGNPPTTAKLFDRHGVEMEGSIYSSGQIRYRFPAVSCQDAGLIRCEAPGASHIKTATLLVRCKPHFAEGYVNRTAEDSGSVELSFRFRAHSTTLSGCLIIKDVGSLPPDSHGSSGHATDKLRDLSKTHNVSACNCTGNMSVTGTPPDLTLTVRLDNVRKEEEGLWRLILTNDAGSGHVDFYLHENDSFDPKELGVFPFHIISIVAGVTAAVGAGMCAVFFIFHRLCQGAHTESQPRIEKGTQRTAHAEPEDQEDELVMIDNVVYSAMPSPPYEGIAVCPPPPPAKCSVEVKEKGTQRTAHAEPEDKEDELVMIDNVVYSAMPSRPYEEIAVCPPPPPAKSAVSK